MNMGETYKWITVLTLGYSGFAPMTIGKNYRRSIGQVNARKKLLESLDVLSLYEEAEKYGKKVLEKLLPLMFRGEEIFAGTLPFIHRYQEVDTSFLFFKDEANRLKREGAWNEDEWREYMCGLSELGYLLDDSIKRFAEIYEYKLSKSGQYDTKYLDSYETLWSYCEDWPEWYEFFIENKIINQEIPYKYFQKCLSTAHIEGLCEKSKVKLCWCIKKGADNHLGKESTKYKKALAKNLGYSYENFQKLSPDKQFQLDDKYNELFFDKNFYTPKPQK